ncbi:unnamed protein product [Lymnaea stagnalis]|uniref:Sushi domain-containing protein n=1 Tax=Lymnaea stagnalis TaxID=6523 RepID=A0AAV2H0J7_LYMST
MEASIAKCDTVPAVLNAKFLTRVDNITQSVTFECLAGFYMSGSPRVECISDVIGWGPTPTCHIINKDTHLYTTVNVTTEEWWYYILAGLLGLIVLTLVIAALCHCCWCPTHVVSVYPYVSTPSKAGRRARRWCLCCRRRKMLLRLEPRERKDSVFWVTDYLLRQTDDRGPHSGTHSVVSSGHTGTHGPTAGRAYLPASQGRTSEVHSKSSAADGMTSVESPREVQVYRNVRPAKDPGKVWLPHKHNVRNINTSTK